jgi:hypothetical protein
MKRGMRRTNRDIAQSLWRKFVLASSKSAPASTEDFESLPARERAGWAAVAREVQAILQDATTPALTDAERTNARGAIRRLLSKRA